MSTIDEDRSKRFRFHKDDEILLLEIILRANPSPFKISSRDGAIMMCWNNIAIEFNNLCKKRADGQTPMPRSCRSRYEKLFADYMKSRSDPDFKKPLTKEDRMKHDLVLRLAILQGKVSESEAPTGGHSLTANTAAGIPLITDAAGLSSSSTPAEEQQLTHRHQPPHQQLHQHHHQQNQGQLQQPPLQQLQQQQQLQQPQQQHHHHQNHTPSRPVQTRSSAASASQSNRARSSTVDILTNSGSGSASHSGLPVHETLQETVEAFSTLEDRSPADVLTRKKRTNTGNPQLSAGSSSTSIAIDLPRFPNYGSPSGPDITNGSKRAKRSDQGNSKHSATASSLSHGHSASAQANRARNEASGLSTLSGQNYAEAAESDHEEEHDDDETEEEDRDNGNYDLDYDDGPQDDLDDTMDSSRLMFSSPAHGSFDAGGPSSFHSNGMGSGHGSRMAKGNKRSQGDGKRLSSNGVMPRHFQFGSNSSASSSRYNSHSAGFGGLSSSLVSEATSRLSQNIPSQMNASDRSYLMRALAVEEQKVKVEMDKIALERERLSLESARLHWEMRQNPQNHNTE